VRRYDILLMDADETLFDFHKAEAEALRQTLEESGIACTPETEELYSGINDALWKAFERGEVTKPFLQKARFVQLFEQLGITEGGEAAAERYPIHLGEASYPLPGAEKLCQLLEELGCRLCLTTNGISYVQHRRLEKSPLRKYFSDENVFVSEDTGSQKPQIEYYAYIFDKIKPKDRARILAVGDSLSSDIKGGINAGVDTCWYNPKGMSAGDVQPTYDIRTLDELLRIVDPDCEEHL